MKSTSTSILFEFENKIKILLSWKKKKKSQNSGSTCMQGVLLKSMATEARIQEGLIQKRASTWMQNKSLVARNPIFIFQREASLEEA